MRDLATVQMVVSISKQYPTLKSDLKDLADEAKRSLSNYIILILSEHVKEELDKKKD
jgi:hypothetical protein